jgi:hypothetical protein
MTPMQFAREQFVTSLRIPDYHFKPTVPKRCHFSFELSSDAGSIAP